MKGVPQAWGILFARQAYGDRSQYEDPEGYSSPVRSDERLLGLEDHSSFNSCLISSTLSRICSMSRCMTRI